MRRLGNPQNAFPSIHIAGTNGKGSVAATTASILAHAGFRVGLYTSPHLERLNERFKVNGRDISNKEMAQLVTLLRPKAANLTQFEFLTAMAFVWFARQKIDVAVVEVGLGGRLDATNVLSRVLTSVITTIDLDHTDWLGNNLRKIAYEKAGIIKPSVPVVTAATGVALAEIRRLAKRQNAHVYTVTQKCSFKTTLKGAHQQQNAAIVEEVLKHLPWIIPRDVIQKGFLGTRWPGRYEELTFEGHRLILDGAHNPAGMTVLVNTLKQQKIGKVKLLFGALADKDFGGMIRLIAPHVSFGVSIPLNTSRSVNPDQMASHDAWKGKVVSCRSIYEGMSTLMKKPSNNPILVSGSLYLIGAFRSWLRRQKIKGLALVMLISGVAFSESDIPVSSTTLKADKITIDILKQEAHSEGHFELIQTSGTLKGRSADYNWKSSTGVIHDARGESGEWRFWGETLVQPSPNMFVMDDADVTSCNLDPPHYYMRSSRTRVYTGKKMKMTNARLTVDKTPIFYAPFFNKSFKKKIYTLRIEPGQSARDGVIIDSYLGIPLSPHSYTKFKWKHFERTGYKLGLEHDYFLDRMRGHVEYEYVRDYNPDPQPQAREYRARWNHYQRLTDELTFRTNSQFQSVQTFGNTYGTDSSQVYVENKTRGLLSEGEFVYQFSKATLSANFDRSDKFDSSVSSQSFISKLTLPRMSFNTTELTFKNIPFKTSFNINYTNETNDRSTPQTTLRYQRSALVGTKIKREFLISKKMTITPSLGYSQSWKDRLLSTGASSKDIYVGRYNSGLNVRQRITHASDLNLGYSYVARLRTNQTLLDSLADDHGIETNSLSGSVNTRVGRSTLFILSSGYNFRKANKSDPSYFDHQRARITPPRLDVQYEATNKILFDFSETYSIYDFSNRRNFNTPLNTSGGVQVGNQGDLVNFSHRFSYSKTQPGRDAELIFNDKLKFFLTPRWYVDLTLSYRAYGPQSFNYRKVSPIERSISVVRDLHCWLLRVEFSSRPGVREAAFYIDLKTNMTGSRNVFNGKRLDDFYPYANPKPDVSEIFPASVNEK